MQNSQRKPLAALPLALAASLAAPAFGQFEDIGAQDPVGFLITGDGEVGYGQFISGDLVIEPHRWTSAGGIETLINPASPIGFANAASHDGSVVVGYASVNDSGFIDPRALRWDASGTVTELTPAAGAISEAFQISGDGSVAAGVYSDGTTNFHACVWDAAGTLTDIHPTFGDSYSTVIALSDDGSTVLGRTFDPVGSFARYFVWTAATGSVELPLFGGLTISPESISGDGSAIVGRVSLPTFNDFGIFYWSQATGYIIDDPSTGEPSQVRISRDGNRVYGLVSFSVFTDEAAIFTWTPAASFQFDQPNMELSLYGASFDGSVLVGAMGGAGLDRRAFRWSSGTSFVELAAPTSRSFATSVSLDGTVVGGAFIADSGERRSVVWRSSNQIGTNYCGPAVPNSTGSGAKIEMRGSNVSELQALTLTAIDMPQNAFGMFIAANQDGFVMTPGGSLGNLCVTGPAVVRLDDPGEVFNTGLFGSATITLDPSSFDGPNGPIIPTFGERWYFQAWFRDANPTAGSNFTDGASVPIF